MKLYLMTRTDSGDWDHYVGAVIAANSSMDAQRIMTELENHQWDCVLLSTRVEPEIKAGIVLDSFSNG